MAQSQRREYLIHYLLQERREYTGVSLPTGEEEQRCLLRSLMNLRSPAPISGEFLRVQDEYLRERLKERGVTQLGDLRPAQPGLYLWQGDITTLACDAIVNAIQNGEIVLDAGLVSRDRDVYKRQPLLYVRVMRAAFAGPPKPAFSFSAYLRFLSTASF